jgi:hypothetical protein
MAAECILEVIGAVKTSLARSKDTCDETSVVVFKVAARSLNVEDTWLVLKYYSGPTYTD